MFLSCSRSAFKDNGSFTLVNYSDKVIEFVWVTPEGEFYPTSKNISIKYGDSFDVKSLEPGTYDIAIDFKGEYNSFNSKKDKKLCLKIEKGINKIWVVTADGIERH
jgi:hypothetical protein